MGRTATITKPQILEAARAVFLEQGVAATVVDVAKRAKISSASIFKYFATKEELFFAAMSLPPRQPVWIPELATAIGHGDPKADLLLIARRIDAYIAEILPSMMLLMSVHQPSGFPLPPPAENDFAALTAYLAREMALGRIICGDPTVPALTLMHTAAGFAMNKAVQSVSGQFNANRFLEDFILIFWRGLDPNAKGA
jgi:AcrR family transcriptional regulator